MIGTIESKEQQLINGYFQTGTGPQEILILGSCRTLAFLSYLKRWNDKENQFTIRRIDPCDWAVSGVDITSLETDERILSVFKSTSIFIHEYLENYGMCNTSREAEKNVYKFGMRPLIDISIPNWHDRMILANDYIDYGALTPEGYVAIGESEVESFCNLCALTSFPEMGDYFRNNWRTTRFFWRPNHTSAAFTLYIFGRMNKRFLHLPLTDEFWAGAETEDLFKSPCTQVTQQDIDAYKLQWK